jgi:hypothetical protein
MHGLFVLFSAALFITNQPKVNYNPGSQASEAWTDLHKICQQSIIEAGKGNTGWLSNVSRSYSTTDRLWLQRSCAMYKQGYIDGVKSSALILWSITEEKK